MSHIFCLAVLFALLIDSISANTKQSNYLNFQFPRNVSEYGPQPFQITVDLDFIRTTVEKVKLYRPSVSLYEQTLDWADGPPPREINNLASYWANSYSWSATQDQINSDFSHFTTTISGNKNYPHPIPLHFVHSRASRDPENATPLLLLHGWPSSHLEWYKVIDPLSHPLNISAPNFHVVAPDLPGFGFSPAPTHSGLGPREMGQAFNDLMNQLGYTRYAIASTDLGWVVGSWMTYDTDSVTAHATDFFIAQPNATDLIRFAKNETTDEESAYITSLQQFQTENAGYSNIQSTKPLALALAMSDSPVGFAGWVWHLLQTICDGYEYSNEELITTTMMLWIQGTYGNLRAYREFGVMTFLFPLTAVPTAVLQFANFDAVYTGLGSSQLVPRSWVERSVNLTFFRRHESGGHFPAVSQPSMWLEDIRDFFGQI